MGHGRCKDQQYQSGLAAPTHMLRPAGCDQPRSPAALVSTDPGIQEEVLLVGRDKSTAVQDRELGVVAAACKRDRCQGPCLT